jgi:hypothetical protein
MGDDSSGHLHSTDKVMTAGEVMKALDDGTIYNRQPDEWREMLRIAAQATASNPNYAHRMREICELTRHLLAEHEQRIGLEVTRQQHRSNYSLGRRTLRWTIVAAIAAVVAAVAALWPFCERFLPTIAEHFKHVARQAPTVVPSQTASIPLPSASP